VLNLIGRDITQFQQGANMKAWPAFSRTVLLGSVVVIGPVTDAVAAELKLMVPRSMWTVLNDVGPQFERTSGYKFKIVTGIAATLADRISAGRISTFSLAPYSNRSRHPE
jgi:ABC-type molybdate transport system substrate-binding protein